MNVGTFCSGIGAPEVAWGALGWRPVFFSEISPFASAVLKTHWPNVPNLGDMNFAHTKNAFKRATIDIICAGTPCQSFSLAGLRAGMADPRGNLALQFLRLADTKRPRWLVWENVPGVLSSWTDAETDSAGRTWQSNDFDTFVAGLVQIGYGVAWRILDAQYFGLPQQRQRVFVVGYLGNWRRAAAVLFDPESLSRHPSKGKETRPDVTVGTLRSTDGGIEFGHAAAGHLVAGTVSKKWRKGTSGPAGDEWRNLTVGAISTQIKGGVGNEPDGLVVFNMRGRDGENMADQADNLVSLRAASGGSSRSFVAFNYKASAGQSMNPGPIAPTLDVGKSDGLVVFDMRNAEVSDSVAHTLQSGQPGRGWSPNAIPHVKRQAGVRRFTPLECERLQGFPDHFTNIIYRKKPAKDGPRYEALGNSMAVPVLHWIGRRIEMVDKLFPND